MADTPQLFPRQSDHKLNVGKVLMELDRMMKKKEDIENEFLKLQFEYDNNPSEYALNRMGTAYMMLEQIEEDIELLQNLTMYVSNREDRKDLMWGDY